MESQRNIKAKHQKKESRKMLILRDSFCNFQPNVFRLKRRDRVMNLYPNSLYITLLRYTVLAFCSNLVAQH